MPTYAERHRGKMHKYRITRGTHVRDEKTESGKVIRVTYGPGDTIELTEKGAEVLAHLGLRALHGSGISSPAVGKVDIPKNWKTRNKATRLALAVAVSGLPMTDLKVADGVIEAYVKANAPDAGTAGGDGGGGSEADDGEDGGEVDDGEDGLTD